MKRNYCKTKLSTIALILVLTVSAILVALPIATAQEPQSKATFAFINAIPNPVGVNQILLLHVGISDSLGDTEYGWEDLTVSVIDPEGIESTIGPITTDSTGGTGQSFTPDKVGTYKFQTHFPEQVSPVATRGYPAGLVMEASSSEVLEVEVLPEDIPYYPGHSLPSEYWTRPIDAQLREWYKISGNYLDLALNRLAPYNDDAPETAHILWAKQLSEGGLVGGELDTHGFESGDAYQGKFATGERYSIIIGGVLYYNHFEATGGSNVKQEVVAVDLHTGRELWTKSLLDPNGVSQRLSHGQLFFWDSYNYHGTYAYLWTSAGPRGGPFTWHAYDAHTGRWIYSMYNVPGGIRVHGPKGEIYIYNVNTRNGWMTLWNSSRVVTHARELAGLDVGNWEPHGNIYENADELGLEWNITIPEGLQGSARVAFHGDRIIGTNAPGQWDLPKSEIDLWGINLKPNQEGTLLFDKTWTVPVRDLLTIWASASLEEGIFILSGKEIRGLFGFNIDTGEQMWGPTQPQPIMDQYTFGQNSGIMRALSIYEGKIITAGYAGVVHCYDVTTGNLLWTYEAIDHYKEILWSNNWPLIIAIVTDGKIYVTHYEHSPLDPKPRGAPSICLNLDGEVVWKIDGAFRGTEWGGLAVIGDNIIATMDTYDQRIYAIGKGPSATTVEATLMAVPKGTSLTIRGMVTDESPGTKDYALTARFPNGVPAISDEDMSEWMLYVYKQFERPTDLTGVPVTLDAVNPEGKIVHIGTVNSDSYGMFKKMFTPEIEGEYTIIATFEGSKAYYASYAQTAISVGPAPSPDQTIQPEPEAPLITTELAIILAVVAVAVIGIVGYWILKKRK